MKKRSMLAIASLAAGFVVAAVTPSHSAEGGDALGSLDVQDTISSLDQTISDGSLAADDKPQDQRG